MVDSAPPTVPASGRGLWQGVWRRAARHAYAATLRLATPLYMVRQWQRGWVEPGYRQHLGERLGMYRPLAMPPPADLVWLHAASLGEVRAAAPLVEALRAQRPDVTLLLTHGTPTGRSVGAQLLRPGDLQSWLPYDTPGAVRRFLRRYRPSVGVLVESAPWPVLVHEAGRAGVPLVLANARHPPRAGGPHRQRLPWLAPPPLAGLPLVLARSVADAERLRAEGARQVMVCGDLGADHTPHPRLLARGLDWRQRLTRPVVLLAGSREQEEAQVLAAWRACPSPRPLLMVVPRHPQRCDEVAELAASHQFSVARRGRWTEQPDDAALSHDTDIWLGEDPAEAALFYGCADVAMLGGSFVPLGGGNPVEAAACGCPLLMGPNTSRHAQAARAAEHAGAAVRVDSLAEAVPLAVALATSARRNQMVQVALQFAQAHRGAARMMADQVFRYRRRIAGDAVA